MLTWNLLGVYFSRVYLRVWTPPLLGLIARKAALNLLGNRIDMKRLVARILKHAGWRISRFQPWMENYRWIRDLEISTVVDVGANVGSYARFIANTLPKATIYAFEPVPTVSTARCEYTRFRHSYFPFAVSDSTGKVEMHLNEFTPSSSILPNTVALEENFPKAAKTKPIEINTRQLDEVLDAKDLSKNIF